MKYLKNGVSFFLVRVLAHEYAYTNATMQQVASTCTMKDGKKMTVKYLSNLFYEGIAQNIIADVVAEKIYNKVVNSSKQNIKQRQERWEEAFEKREQLKKQLNH